MQSSKSEDKPGMARRMVSDWGMSDTFGPAAFSSGNDPGIGPAMGQRYFSEHTATLIDEETRRIINEAEDGVDEALSGHREHLGKLADALLEQRNRRGSRTGRAPRSIGLPRYLRRLYAGGVQGALP